VAGGLVCLLIAAGAGCRHQEATPENAPRPVQAATVAVSRAAHGARYSATIVPASQVPVAFKSSGYVDTLLQTRGADRRPRDVQQGDAVARGAVLARVQQTDYRARVQQAEARTGQVEAGLAKARADFDRAEQLFAVRSLTQQDLDAARAARDSSQAQLSAAKADVDLAHSALRDTDLTAPFAGVVLEKRIERGSLAAPGSVAFVLGDVRTVKALFGVPDTIVRRLSPGLTLTLSTDALSGRAFTGRITAVSPAADAQTRVFNVEVTLPNADALLRPGMIATVQLDDASGASGVAPIMTVPLGSIVKSETSATGYALFVVESATGGGHDVARARQVTVGNVVGNGIEVSAGVRAGERVITTGATLVKDGDAVRVIP
jgi:multidrug efflux system membrane fusion protein